MPRLTHPSSVDSLMPREKAYMPPMANTRGVAKPDSASFKSSTWVTTTTATAARNTAGGCVTSAPNATSVPQVTTSATHARHDR